MAVFERMLHKATTHAVGALPYALRQPDGLDSSGISLPLVLYLHGAGEKGNDLATVLQSGLPRLAASGELRFPFWLLAPQCPAHRSGWPIDLVAELLQEVAHTHAVDLSRIYATGPSMGGRGTYELAYDYGDLLAAIVPLCAFGIPTLAPRLAKLPVWAFHGEADQVVPFARGQEMAASLQATAATGCSRRFTLLEKQGHSIESTVYAMPELWSWLAEQQRRDS